MHPPALAEHYVDGLMDPIRLPRPVLQENRSRLGEFGYAGQFGQSPVPKGGATFKVDRFLYDHPPAHVTIRWVRFWDKAGTGGGGAYTVGAKVGEWVDSKKLPHYIVGDIVRGQWDSYQREKIIKKVAQMDGKKVRIGIEQEPGSGGKESAQNTIRMLAGYRVKAFAVGQSDGNKEMRADPFSTQVNGHNVILYEDTTAPGYLLTGPWLVTFLDEYRFFPASTYKDQVDAGSGGFNMLTEKRVRAGGL